MLDPGRSLERMSDCTPRGMIVLDRTRLIGSLHQILINQCILGLTFFLEKLIMRAQFKAM